MDPTTTPRAAWSLPEFLTRYQVTRTRAFEDMKAGRLQRVRIGRRILIPVEAAEAWWQSLQTAKRVTRLDEVLQ